MTTRTADNPAFGAEGAGPTFDIEALSEDGEQVPPAETLTAEQVTALVDKKVAQLLQGGSESAALVDHMFAARIESVIAEMHMAPPNLHQAVVFFAAERQASVDDDALARPHLPSLLLISVGIVLTQCAAVAAVVAGTYSASCESSGQCIPGQYCSIGMRQRCDFCGERIPMIMELNEHCSMAPGAGQSQRQNLVVRGAGCKTLNRPNDYDFDGFNTTLVVSVCTNPTDRTGLSGAGDRIDFVQAATRSWCEKCVHPVDLTPDTLRPRTLTTANVTAMGYFVRSDNSGPACLHLVCQSRL